MGHWNDARFLEPNGELVWMCFYTPAYEKVKSRK
jgi:hypothetical protein